VMVVAFRLVDKTKVMTQALAASNRKYFIMMIFSSKFRLCKSEIFVL
jgi:hypothetical protein